MPVQLAQEGKNMPSPAVHAICYSFCQRERNNLYLGLIYFKI